MNTLSVTATISFDREGNMQNMKPNQNAEGSFDRENFREMMSNSSALTLEEYEKYSTASTVKNFYYSADISVNGDDNLSPVSNEENTETKSQSNNFPSFGGGFGGGRENFGNRVLGASSDFTLTDFSGEIAMTQFINGTASITEGVNFDENSGREYEKSLEPLNALSQTSGYFLLVILIIGAAILIILNIFNIRERKYEIGVLTAMGMKKSKVALQFIIEIFIVTIIAVIIGASVGTISSVPVANKLLENQISSQNETQMNIEQNFGRPGNPDDMDIQMPPDKQLGFFDNLPKKGDFNNYISEIDSATNITVVLYMLLIAIGLALVAGAASLLFIMRYSPLKILSNRD